MTSAPKRRLHRRLLLITALGLVIALVGVGAVATDTLGAGNLYDRAVAKIDRFLAGPVPDRSAPDTVVASTPPEDVADLDPDESLIPDPVVGAVGPAVTPVPVPTASPTPTPTVPRVPITFDVVADHKAVFAHELKETWCASAGVQMVLATLHHGNTSNAFQREIQGRVHEWESYKDSHNGDWGPSAMALALDAYGAKGYEVHAYQTRQGALARRGQGDHEDQFAGDPVGVEGCAHLGDDRLQGRRGPGGLLERKDPRDLHPGPVVSGRLEHLGSVRSARHVPEQRRDDPELPAVETA